MDDSELRLENFELALRCLYYIFFQVLQPYLKNTKFVRVSDLGWTPATHVQIWILVDL